MTLKGPYGWPIVGNVLQLDMRRPYLTIADWAKQYGNIYTIKLGSTDAIILTGKKMFNEVLSEKAADFADHFVTFRMGYSTWKSDVFHMKHDERWKRMRKLLFQGLKLHNLKHIEEITQEVISDFIDDIRARKGKVFDPASFIRDSVIQSIFVMAFSTKIEKGSDDMELIKRLESLAVEANSFLGGGSLLDAFPFLRHFGGKTFGTLKEARRINRLLYTTWKDRVNNGDMEGGWFKDLLKERKNGSFLTEENIMMTALDFVQGGFSTTSSSLITFFNVLANYPDVQEKLHKEVDQVIGQDRRVTFADREEMPYTRACIFELLR